jgi:hypothetical protein
MQKTKGKSLALAALVITTAFGAAGCSTTAKTIDSSTELARAAAATDTTVVIGKFQMFRNGEAVKLGEGIFANRATLQLVRNGEDRKIVGMVGRGGEFAWALEPGDYVISRIGFMNRGEKFEPKANLAFTVTADSEAIYVGTITLESTFESGYYGLNGTVDSYAIDDDCAADCAERLARLGLDSGSMVVDLFQPEPSLPQLK